MSIKCTYICDGCGRTLDQNKEAYHVLYVQPHGYANLMCDDDGVMYIYCDECSAYMVQALYAIPKLRETGRQKAEQCRGGVPDANAS